MQEENVGDANPSQDDVKQSVQVVRSEHHEVTGPPAPIRREGPRLPATQEIALQHLTAGNSIVQAARAAQVDRRTVYRWIRSDPQFAAAYNAWQHEMLASGRARLLAMADLALDTVQSAMMRGNANVAVQVAKATGAMDIPKPGTTDPSRFYRRKRQRDAKWQKELADAERTEWFNQRSQPERSPAHCEYMIDSYIKCRREALRTESPEDRARRLAEQPKYHRNYDQITLRLLKMMDEEDAAAPTTKPSPLLDRPKWEERRRGPTGNPDLLTWRERQVLEQLRRKMLGEAVEVEEVTLAPWEVKAINEAREKLLDAGFIPDADKRVVPGPRDPCGSGKPIGDRKDLESKAVPPRALPTPSPTAPPPPQPVAPPDPFLTGEEEG